MRGRYSIIGIEPDLIFRAFGDRAEINRDPKANRDGYEAMAEPTLDALRRMIAESRIHLPDGLPPMSAGVFGYLGYDMVRQMEALARAQPRPARLSRRDPDPPDDHRHLRRGQGRDHHRHAGAAAERHHRRAGACAAPSTG